MLELVREYLPISGFEWELVAIRHTTFHPDQERMGDQLKKKFNKHSKTRMGTGDPTMPNDVCEAKEIRRLIIEKSEGVTGSEDEPFTVDNVNMRKNKSLMLQQMKGLEKLTIMITPNMLTVMLR